MGSCSSQIADFEFSQEDIASAVKNHRLLSMEIECSLRCNFDCCYCYVPEGDHVNSELTQAEIKEVVVQGKGLGVRKVIILGGEPSIYPHISEMIHFLRDLDLEVEMFTNGTGVTAPFAAQLFEQGVRVVLKMNTFDEHLQDRLAGKIGAHEIIWSALENLKKAGYPSEDRCLGVSTIICQQNLPELPEMWRWLRDQSIVPYFEMITPQEKASKNGWLTVKPPALKRLFQQISDIDRRFYGKQWDPQPPLVGNRCLRHQFSCLVTSKGDVMPCVGVTIALGNIRRQSLGDILRDSQVIKDLRDYRRTIKGPCGNCGKAATCYGCRGAAYQMTGDYLASDPLCWNNYSA